MRKTCEHKVTLTSGPFHIPEEDTADHAMNRLVISIKNPTDNDLEAKVRLGICRNPNPANPTIGSFPLDSAGDFVIGESKEHVLNLGSIKVKCKSCARIERFIDASTESKSTFRIVTMGDYEVADGSSAGGKLEISVLVGNEDFSDEFGLHTSEASTFIPYADWKPVD